jgi:hypothetical protein
MTQGVSIVLINPVQGHKAIASEIWPWSKAMLMAQNRVEVVAKPAKRTQEHSARLHAMLGWISKHAVWAGQKHDIDTWKRLLVAAWCRARGEPVSYLPALDGQGIDIVFRRTSELTGREMAELIEFIYAWGVSMELQIPEPTLDPSTGRMVDMTRRIGGGR